MYILIAVAIAFILMLMIPVRIYAVFHNGADISIKIGIYKKKILLSEKEEAELLDEQAEEKERNEPAPLKKLMFYKELAVSLKEDIFGIIGYASNHGIQIETLNFRIDFGWDDAAAVGMLYGLVNAVVYGTMGIVHNNLIVKKWNISINPDCSKEIFDIKLNCILKTRLVHISIIGIKFLKLLIKTKKISNTGGKEYGASD